MSDLYEMSSRKTEYKNTRFLEGKDEAELAEKLIGLLSENGFRARPEAVEKEAYEEAPSGNEASDGDGGHSGEAGDALEKDLPYLRDHKKSLENAELIFAGGRGLHTRENYEKLCRLAELYGAEVAVTRPLVFEGFAGESRMVGIMGAVVRPKLLLCFGISGSIQFMAGVKGAGKVVAVNNYFNSQIFRYCNEAVLGDAEKVLDGMLGIVAGG